MSNDQENKYFIVVPKEAHCMSCKKTLMPEDPAAYPPYVLVHRYHLSGYHMACIPRLISAESKLARIKEEYGVEITLEMENEDG